MSAAFALPGRASDAGPLPGNPPTVSELLDEAEESIRMANRCLRPENVVERVLLRKSILAARECLDSALEALK